jgi:hypothetical protein
MPTRFETLLIRANYLLSTCFKVVFLLSRGYGYVEYYWSISSVGLFNIIWRVSTQMWIVLLMVSIISSLVQMMISGERYKRNADREADGQLPMPSPRHGTSDGVLSLSWTEDYRGNAKRMLTWTLLNPGTWLSSTFVGLFCMLSMACDYTRGTIIQPDGVIYFGLGTLIALIFRFAITYGEQQQKIPDRNSRVFVRLQVHAEGIDMMRGQNQYSAPWQSVSRIVYRFGLVSLRQNLLFMLIPASAFHSRNDARWLTRTMTDLKCGRVPPDYDWSSYGVVDRSSGGVWPPPPVAH